MLAAVPGAHPTNPGVFPRGDDPVKRCQSDEFISAYVRCIHMTTRHTGCEPGEVMASVDESSAEFVIADLACDDAWLSVGEADAPVLENWC
ncbi:hypothetical protein GCM10009000_031570 [Halobacterium noricense]